MTSRKSYTRVSFVSNNLWIGACDFKFEQGMFSNNGFFGLQ